MEGPLGYWVQALRSGDTGTAEPENEARLDLVLPTCEIAEPGGIVSFYYQVSSERGFDFLRFLLNDVEQTMNAFPQSGEQTSWHLALSSVPPGKHKITWRYEKDGHGRAGMDVAYVTEIQLRNALVQPITLSASLRLTHAVGDLGASTALLEAAVSDTFGARRENARVGISQSEGGNLAGSAGERRLTWSQHDSLYTLYDVSVRVSCSSSSTCANVSATMGSIAEESEVLTVPIRTALSQPSLKCVDVAVSKRVDGDPAPGAAMPASSPASVISTIPHGTGPISYIWWVGAVICVLSLLALGLYCCLRGSAAGQRWISSPRDGCGVFLTERSADSSWRPIATDGSGSE